MTTSKRWTPPCFSSSWPGPAAEERRQEDSLIADRLRAHTDGTVEQWLDAHRDRLEIFCLPRYSPEMNPVEYLNNDMKQSVNAAGLPEKKETLRSRMQKFMHKLLLLPDHVANYFLNPSVQYASVWEL